MRHGLRLLFVAFAVPLLLTACGSLGSVVPSLPSTSSSPSSPSSPSSSSSPSPGAVTWVPATQVSETALSLLITAQHSVVLDMYELGNPALVAALVADQARGLSVRVILDATESQSAVSGRALIAAGVPVRWDRVPHGIDHVKLLVVDGSTTLLGGVNWGTSSSYTTDGDVLVARDALAAGYFAATWATLGGHSTAPPEGSGAWSGSALGTQMTALLAHATTSVDVAANYLTSWTVQDALAAAVQRGVAVHVVLNPTAYGAHAAMVWLTAHGVTVRWAPTTPYLHAKILIVDGRTLWIGSSNFSYHGLSVNQELDTVVAMPPGVAAWWQALWARSTPAS